MWKLVTGEPYAGKSHVRFGGRGGAEPSLPLSLKSAPHPPTKLRCGGVVWWCSLGGEELVEFGEAAVVVGLVDDFFGGLEVVGDGCLVLV